LARPFLAARAARCCLSLPASLDKVDAGRIGLYGVSRGGFLTWLVNGSDPRVQCATAIYGTAEYPFRSWKPARRWQTDPDGGLTIDLHVTGDAWLFVRQYHPGRGFTITSTPIVLPMPQARGRPRKLLFSGPTRRDGWGYHMTINPQGAAGLEYFVTIDRTDLTVLPGRDGLGRLIFFGITDPDNRPGPKVRALEIEVAGAAALDILAHVHISDIYAAKLEAPADGRHVVPLESFKNADKPLPDFARLGYLLFGGQPRPGETLRIKGLAWK
jgi:hypothetical protein